MRQSVIRDINGKELGKLDKFITYDEESWYKDQKCRNVVFPSHTSKMNGDVEYKRIEDI